MRLLQLGHLSRELLSQLLYPGAALSLHLLKALLLSVLKDFQLLLMVGFLGLQLLFFGLNRRRGVNQSLLMRRQRLT